MHSSRQLAAIMFTDIVGYTALMGKDEQKAFELLDKNRQIQKPIIEQHNGRWIKELGDGVMASFNTVSEAVNAAITIQQTCNASKQFQLRVGIHLGEVVFENDDVFGNGVNIASRIQAITHPGSIYISETVHNSISNKKEFQTKFIKEEKLKNVKEPVKIYQVIAEGVVQHQLNIGEKIKPKPKVLFVAVAVVAILIAGYFVQKFFIDKQSSQSVTADGSADKSIAVLPFDDMSAGKDQEYFSDGLSEDLLNLLSKIPELKVIGRTSSFSFKGKNKDLRVIGQKLGVANVLDGSVRKEGNKVRVTTQLIRTADGVHLWGEQYNRDMDSIFELQDEIAEAVVQGLKLKLLKTKSSPAPTTVNKEVYNLILQGNYFLEKRDKENLAKALDLYLKALSMDSLDARTWAKVGHCYILQLTWAHIDRKEGMQKARLAANKSVTLDGNLAEGHYVLGLVKMWDFDWPGAETEYQKVLDLEPGNADALRSKGFLYRCTGRFDEAIQLTKKSISFDPIKAATYFNFGQLLYHSNHLEEAIASYKKVLELHPQFPRAHIFLGKVYLLQGKVQMALAEMELDADEAWRNFGVILVYQALGRKKEVDKMLNDHILKFAKDEAYQIAEVYALRGEKDKAFLWLEKAYLAKEARLTYLKGDPLLKNLESDPRHKVFLKKMNLLND